MHPICWPSHYLMANCCIGGFAQCFHQQLLPRVLWCGCCPSRPHSELLEKRSIDDDGANQNSWRGGSFGSKLVSERSRTLEWAIQQLKPMQVWDWLFRSCEVNGRLLLREGLIDVKDIEECILRGKCKKLGVKLPSWCILQCLLSSARSNSTGLLILDEIELTNSNWSKDKVFEWFIGPLLIMKEQIKGLHLDEDEEACLKILIMTSDNVKPEDWDGSFPSNDKVRKAQLHAILRRLQGIVASMTQIPTFPRRFNNLVKVLCIEAIETSALSSRGEGSSKRKTTYDRSLKGQDARNSKSKSSDNSEIKSDDNASTGKAKERADDDCGIV